MKAGNTRFLRTIPLVLIAILLCPIAYGKTIYVDDDATVANDGSSWENAYVYLQEALDEADTAEKPVEIRVAQGIYKPDEGLLAIPEFDWRTTTFQLINGVSIKGGYAGFGKAEPDARDIKSYETILSGDLNGDDDPHVWESDLENSYHVVTSSSTDNTALLDGFVITAGKANGRKLDNGPDYKYRAGGGLYNISGNPTLNNCTISENWASEKGGGMYNSGGNPTLTNCTFSNCLAYVGGGMSNVDSRATIIDCSFDNNEAFKGAGIYNESSDLILTKCIFQDNVQSSWYWGVDIFWYRGGGGVYNSFSNPTLTDCIFIGNAAEQGGGMFNNISNPILFNCIFTSNRAYEFPVSYGGGMINVDSSPILINCTFTGNRAETSVLNGTGGGMHNFGSSPNLINCIFAGNLAENSNAMGCSSWYWWHEEEKPSDVEIVNCILWDGGDEISTYSNSVISINYCNIQGGQAGIYDPCEAVIWCEGNIDLDPLFAEPGYWAHIDDVNIVVEPNEPNAVWVDGDYHLKSQYGRWDPVSESWVMDDVTSPCIDAGDPNSPVGDEPEPNGGRINMGAYGGTGEASKSDYTWWFATTGGPVVAEGLGIILPHEHIFTDLRGPTTRGYGEADTADVVRVMGPLLEEARQKGVGLLIECSSIGVGRNVSIIAQVAKESGLPVVVPTGVYGRANYAPAVHRNMSEDELTTLFINEIREGIDGTGIKAGFIKIATDNGPLTALEEKFLRAAGRAANETGAAVASTVKCDPDTQQCLYEYTATASVQKIVKKKWKDDNKKRAFVRSFTVHDSVNEIVTSERVDRVELSVVTWNPNSPLKESVPVTLVLGPSTQAGQRIEIRQRAVILCAPTGPLALCP